MKWDTNNNKNNNSNVAFRAVHAEKDLFTAAGEICTHIQQMWGVASRDSKGRSKAGGGNTLTLLFT